MASTMSLLKTKNLAASGHSRTRYRAPDVVENICLSELLTVHGRSVVMEQGNLFSKKAVDDPQIFFCGSLDLLRGPNVAVIGSRKVSEEGKLRAHRIAREMAEQGVTVTSGLAKGVDTNAHNGALRSNGRTVAVIGTPIDRCYPAENSELQETIYSEHLLISQFPIGSRTYPSDFPKRNQLMAAVTDASIIVEASDSSGTLHQAAECVRLRRWLFIMQSVVENPNLSWPKKFLNEERVAVLSSTKDVVDRIT